MHPGFNAERETCRPAPDRRTRRLDGSGIWKSLCFSQVSVLERIAEQYSRAFISLSAVSVAGRFELFDRELSARFGFTNAPDVPRQSTSERPGSWRLAANGADIQAFGICGRRGGPPEKQSLRLAALKQNQFRGQSSGGQLSKNCKTLHHRFLLFVCRH
jgi:hypothetical protein